jgi:predicted CXXCH cytochrome family protein
MGPGGNALTGGDALRRNALKASLICALLLIAIFAGSGARAQTGGDVLGMHDLTVGGKSPIQAPGALGCTFCHAPHSGAGDIPALWNQTLSKQSYTPYNSTTYHQTGQTQPTLGAASSLCLSCHDGTVAIGQSTAYGKMPTVGSMYPQDILGTNMQNSHPFSLVLPMKDSPDLASTLVANGTTLDLTHAVKLINGNVECTSCHNPHVQAIDKISQNFLVLDSSMGRLCLACHDPNRTVTGQVNPLTGWTQSIHQRATNTPAVGAHVGTYDTVAKNACISCHMPHNGQGVARLLRPATPPAPSLDPTSQDCVTCHSGGLNLTPVAPDIASELAKISHPLPAGTVTSIHDPAEAAVLNNNRHATCPDCHNAHADNQVTTFAAPPLIRTSETDVVGVSASDGVTILDPAINQYENCLRCHGTSSGTQILPKFGYFPTRDVAAPDPLNVIPEFSATATSSHPVTHDRSSALPQPSLLTNMINIGRTGQSRLMGVRIFCTDCHNSDDNREFGQTGPNGPHGSIYPHILERQYQFSQVAAGAGPGSTIINLFAPPDLGPTGPYALCAKCHDLTNILSNASFTQHASHINAGFTCSTCHTAHGMGAISANITGERLVNFDLQVVGMNGASPISYNRSTNTCTLTCHTYNHNPDGSVSQHSGARRK